MGRILTWHDDEGDWHYAADTQEQIDESSLKILQERLDNQYLHWPDDAEEIASDILARKDGSAAYNFLRGRTDFEYEGISLDVVR